MSRAQKMQATKKTAAIIRENWERVQSSVADACVAANRSPDEVTIVGVAKYVGAELTAQLVEAGCSVIGENRPQTLWEKTEWFAEHGSSPLPSWHMIGHLQRNKVRRTLPLVSLVQSVDSLRLAQAIDAEAQQAGFVSKILIDVNVTQDTTKTGLPAAELMDLVHQVTLLPGLQLVGLMAMSSLDANRVTVQNEFAQVRLLRDRVASEYADLFAFKELSMGMSGDYHEAIAEGATMVRIGSSLWEGLL